MTTQLSMIESTKTLEGLAEFTYNLRKGDVQLSDIKQWWDWFYQNGSSIKEELLSRKWPQARITKAFRVGKYSSSDPKKYLVSSALEAIAKSFYPSRLTGSLWTMTMYEVSMPAWEYGHSKGWPYQWTQEDIDANAQDYRERLEAHQAHLESCKEKLENPQTIDDYQFIIRVKGRESLTKDQEANYSQLLAERTRTTRLSQKASEVAVSTNALEGLEFLIKKGHHDKKGIDIWIVGLSDRIDKDTFVKMKTRAKAHNGYYSRYSKGFVFESEADATAFTTIDDSNGEQTVEQLAQARQQKAIDHLSELAESIREDAQAWMDEDRLVNTARRVRIYESCLSDRQYQLQIADTLEVICEQLATNNLQWLDRVRYGSDVHELYSILNQARWARHHALGKSGTPDPICAEDVPYVQYPYPSIHCRTINDIYSSLSSTSGFTLAFNRLRKEFTTAKKDYLTFVSHGRPWDALMKFYDAPNWKVKDSYALAELRNRILPVKRLERMELKTVHELKQACAEFITVLQSKPELDPIKRLELSLVGRNRKFNDYYPTKPEVAKNCLSALNVEGKDVLEPSAGNGNLADVLMGQQPNRLVCVELNADLANILRLKGHDTIQGNFLWQTVEELGQFDVIVMNPPFGHNQKDAVIHAEYAKRFLKEDGRLAVFSMKGLDIQRMTCMYDEPLPFGWAEGTDISGMFQIFSF